MTDKIRVIFFKEGDAWLAQGLERDICVQADTVEELYDRFDVAVMCERKDGNLDNITEAPEEFFMLWDEASEEYVADEVDQDQFEIAMAA